MTVYASVLKRYEGKEKGVAAATGRWLASTKMGKRNLQRYPGKYITVRYETLASEPEKTCREVCDFLGEAFEPSMLTMQGAPDHGRYRAATVPLRIFNHERFLHGQSAVFAKF